MTPSLLKPYLPHRDPNPTARLEKLSDQQGKYKYNHRPSFLPEGDPALEDIKFPVLQSPVPREDSFNAKYIAGRLQDTLPILTNRLLTKARALWDPLDKLVRVCGFPAVSCCEKEEDLGQMLVL